MVGFFQTFRKTLTSMFMEKLDLDVVFFETAVYLQKFPHMILECVPMPRETGDLAPIYFKVRNKKIVQFCARISILECHGSDNINNSNKPPYLNNI